MLLLAHGDELSSPAYCNVYIPSGVGSLGAVMARSEIGNNKVSRICAVRARTQSQRVSFGQDQVGSRKLALTGAISPPAA